VVGGLCLLLLVVGTQATARPLAAAASASVATVSAGGNDNAYATVAFADDGEETLDEFVDEVIRAVNRYWAAEFKQRGRAYHPPKVVRAHAKQRIRSKCGNSRGAEHSYCNLDETVFLDMDSDDVDAFETLWDDDRAFVIVTTVGHEWGHHVQTLLGVFDVDEHSVETENQADCLMGVFARAYTKSSDWLGQADFRDAIEDTRESGDDPDTPADERTHGTPDERVEAFLRGYNGKKMEACGL